MITRSAELITPKRDLYVPIYGQIITKWFFFSGSERLTLKYNNDMYNMVSLFAFKMHACGKARSSLGISIKEFHADGVQGNG